MADAAMMQNISKRIEALEGKMWGGQNVDPKKMMKSLKLIDQTLNTFASKRDRFKQVFTKAPQISELVQAGYEDTINDEDEFKLNYLLSRESDILQTCHKLDNISELSKLCLDDTKTIEQMSKLSTHSDRMGKLQQLQLNDLEKVQGISEELDTLLDAYKEIICSISAQFVRWDHQLKVLEDEKERQKHE